MDTDEKYISLVVDPIRVSSGYRPKFGQSGTGLELEGFAQLYEADPLCSWVGLDSPHVYAAHKAAGGMTSIYRQLGIGCERLFRAVLQDMFSLTEIQASWEYRIPSPSGQDRILKLDGRIDQARTV